MKALKVFFLITGMFCASAFAQYERTHKPVQSALESGNPGSLTITKGDLENSGGVVSNSGSINLNGTTYSYSGTYDEITGTGDIQGAQGRGVTMTLDSDSNWVYSTNQAPVSATVSGDTATITGSQGYSMTGTYDPNLNTVTVVGPRGNQTVGTYDPTTNTTTYTNSQGDQVVVSYNSSDGTSSYEVISPDGTVIPLGSGSYNGSTYVYTPAQRGLTVSRSPSSAEATVNISKSQDQGTITGVYGRSITGTYNPQNQMVTITGPQGNQVEGIYDPSNNTVTYQTREGNQVVVSYSGDGSATYTVDQEYQLVLYPPSTGIAPYVIPVTPDSKTLGTATYDPTTGSYIYTGSEYGRTYTTDTGQTLFTNESYAPTSGLDGSYIYGNVYAGIQGNRLVVVKNPYTGTDTYVYVNDQGQPQEVATEETPEGSSEKVYTGTGGNTLTESSKGSWQWD